MKRYVSLFLVGCSISVFGMPQNGDVIAGTVQFHEKNIVEASDGAIIHWSDFSIEADETFSFLLPSANSAVLNRVIDPIPSRILGKLDSNGSVLLMNPSGILVGKDAVIHTGSLILSTLEVLDSAWIEKKELIGSGFSKGLIVNQGKISGNKVGLIGYEIWNRGTIVAKTIGLTAACEFQMQMDPFLIQTAPSSQTALNVDFSFESLGDVFSMNMPGPTLILEGALTGETVYCLGDYIDIKKESAIRSPHGGDIYIGGNNPSAMNRWRPAKVVRIDGSIQADGLRGGNIIAWSDGAMGFYGYISARGIEEGGHVEVSGNQYLDFKGLADLRAESGRFGTLLMDPPNIFINTNPDSPGVVVGTTYTIPALAAVDINNVVLGGQLDLSNVTISSNTAGGGTGNITVDAPINWTMMPSTLLLDTTGTAGSIFINDAITSATGGDVLLNSGADISVLTALGQIDLNGAGGSISLNAAGNITIQGTTPSLQVQGGKITLIANSNITVAEAINATGTDLAPATPQILARADADHNNIGDLQIGTPTMTSTATLHTQDGAIYAEGYNVNIGVVNQGAGSEISAQGGVNRGDVTINAYNNFNLIGGSTNGFQSVVVGLNGDTIISVHHDANLIGGSALGTVALVQPGGGQIVCAVGNDLLIRGGSGDNTDTGIDGLSSGLPAEVSVLVGRDLRIEQQMGGTTSVECIIGANDNTMVRVGRDIFIQGAFAPMNHTFLLSVTPGSIYSMFCGGNIILQNEVTQPEFQFLPFFNSDSTDLRAAGDITIGADIDKTGANGYIHVEADASFADLWTATPNAIVPLNGDSSVLAGTPLATPFAVASDGLGAVIEETGSFGAALWTTDTGDITVLSADRTTLGAGADFTLGAGSNQVSIATVSGNVEINGFRNIFADLGFGTSGNIFFRSMNDITINDTLSGNNLLYVVDEQGPNGIIGGIWDSSGGSFVLNATGSLTSRGTLQIFTARRGNNTINGLLNGVFFQAGTLFIDTDTEHWCVYFGGPGSTFANPVYTVFYKDCLQQLSYEANIVTSEFLVDLHPLNEFPGWFEEFFIEQSDAGIMERYLITRRYLHALNLPKYYTFLLREGRVGPVKY